MDLDKEFKKIGQKLRAQIQASDQFTQRLIKELKKYDTKD